MPPDPAWVLRLPATGAGVRLAVKDCIDVAGTVTPTWLTVPLNLAGLPAVALPVPTAGVPIPASLQLVGGWLGEEQLLGWAARIERAQPGALCPS